MRMRLGIPRIAQVLESVRSPRTKLTAIACVALMLALVPVLFTLLPAPSAPGKLASSSGTSGSSTSSSATGASGTTGTTGSKSTATSTRTSSAPATSAPATSAPGGTYISGSPHGCLFEKADQPLHVAFCDSFSQPMGTGNRAGGLNGTVWGVSRLSDGWNPGQGQYDSWQPTQLDACGTTVSVKPESDVQLCNGQLVESVNDGGGDTTLAAYPKQPFDIAGRTGTVTFDVSADSQGSHAAWPTFFYTDQPTPAPAADNPPNTGAANPRNGFGFALDAYGNTADNQFIDNCANTNDTSVGEMFVSRNYVLQGIAFTTVGCVQRPAAPGAQADTSRLQGLLNHFEVRISQSHVEVWGTDPGATALKELAFADNVNLPLSRGLIWIEDVHYHADKFNTQGTHTFAWDNVGFDGPVLPRDLANDVNDALQPWNGAYNLGWEANPTLTLHVPGVSPTAQASGALLTLNYWTNYVAGPFKYRLNGNAWHTVAWPYPADHFGQSPIGIPVSLAEVVPGTNTIDFDASSIGTMIVSNVDLILIGAGGVPTCVDPSTC